MILAISISFVVDVDIMDNLVQVDGLVGIFVVSVPVFEVVLIVDVVS